jgi:serine-type D-Ala-D-Ala carboxypeptidase (penicillin-binding protein 5/6)
MAALSRCDKLIPAIASLIFFAAIALPHPVSAASMKPEHPAKSTPSAKPSPNQPTPADGRPTIDTEAQTAIVIDYNSGQVLFAKEPDKRIPTASMSKIMTAYVVYEYLRDGKAKFDDMLPVSKEAWQTGGSKMFVPYPGQVSIDDLLQGMIIQSGNDACIVLAEGLAGSQQAFVEKMNEEAQRIGLKDSHFADVNGLPADDHYMTARDLSTLATHYITDFPQYYRYEAVKEFTYNGIKQGNRNPLLYQDLGADGIKTGHTDEAGYGLVGSALRNGRRVIMVLTGMESMQHRAQESEKVLEWAYREFEDVTVAKAGTPVDLAPVWLGENATVPAGVAKDAIITVPHAARHGLKVVALYDGPVKAPVTQGEQIGRLEVTAPDIDPVEIPLVAMTPVERLGPIGRAAEGVAHYLWERHN